MALAAQNGPYYLLYDPFHMDKMNYMTLLQGAWKATKHFQRKPPHVCRLSVTSTLNMTYLCSASNQILYLHSLSVSLYSGTSLLRTPRNKDTSLIRTLPVVPAT